MTAVMDETGTVSLAERLVELEAAERPLAEELNRLKAEHADALARHDYARIVELEPQVNAAREAHGIAAASTEALRKHADVIQREREEAQRVVELQQQRDAARVQLEAAQKSEGEYLAELENAVAAISVGIDAVRHNIARALALEGVAHEARISAYQALVVLGERESGMAVSRPNRCSALLEYDPVIRAVYKAR